MPIDWSQVQLSLEFFLYKKKKPALEFQMDLGITLMKMGPNFLLLFTFEDIIVLLQCGVESHSSNISCKKNIYIYIF